MKLSKSDYEGFSRFYLADPQRNRSKIEFGDLVAKRDSIFPPDKSDQLI